VNDTHPLLTGFPVVTTIPLLWGDEDAFGHVNNLIYLRWCETARVEYLQRVALWVELPPAGAGPILASMKCDYKAQLNYPDTVQVGSRIGRIGNSSFQMEHCVVSRNLGEIAAAVESTLVLFDYKLRRPVPIPAEIRRTICDLEGRPFELAAAAAV
jgi:acyl-CoA thioester hydrolase